MIDSNKLINALNHLNASVIYNADGTHIRWTGELPDTDLWAYSSNVFISEKNTTKWLRTIEKIPMPVVIEPKVEAPVRTLQEIIEQKDSTPIFENMTKKEIDEYALEHYDVELDRRQTKDKMIAQIKGLK